MQNLRASDLRQHAYCPRVAFYRATMPGAGPPETVKMQVGREEEDRIARLEARRKLRRYKLSEGVRRYRVPLASARLGVSGICDLVIESPAGVYPVDFKRTTGGVARGHKLQLTAYAMAIEEASGKAVERGFVYLLPTEDAAAVPMDTELREAAAAAARAIREALEAETLPPPTNVRARCQDCEFRNFCNDVF